MPPGKEGRICSRRAPYLSSYNGRMYWCSCLLGFLCLRSLITWINLTTFSIFIFFSIPFFSHLMLLLYSCCTPLALLLCLCTLPRVYPESTLHLRWHCSFAYVPKSTAACSTAKVLRITHRLSMDQSPRVYTASALALLLRHYIWYLLVCVFTGLTQSATRT